MLIVGRHNRYDSAIKRLTLVKWIGLSFRNSMLIVPDGFHDGIGHTRLMISDSMSDVSKSWKKVCL